MSAPAMGISVPRFPADNPMCEAAVHLASLGPRIVPLHNLDAQGHCTCQPWRDEKGIGECRTPGKHPRFQNHAKLATNDEKRIRALWQVYPEANIGISLSKESGIWALDKDPRNGGEYSDEWLTAKHGQRPYTTTSQTGGGGTHELWTWPTDCDVPFAFDIADGLQVLGEGHILVAPPSLHPSGRRYEWAAELGPDEMAPQPAPEWLIEAIRVASRPPAPVAVSEKRKYPPAEIGPILSGCGWLRHCSEDAATLGEPEWYAMLAVVVRCANGEALAHEMSRAYAGYSQSETASKLRHALEGAGPTTCAKVRHSLGGARCQVCPHWGRIKSPIVLGTRRPALIPIASEPPEETRYGAKPLVVNLPEAVCGKSVEIAAKAVDVGATTISRAKVVQDADPQAFEAHVGPPDSPIPPEAFEGVEGPDLRHFPLTDSGNGERMVALYADQARYCIEMQKYLVWDGRRWAGDLAGRIKQHAKVMARMLYMQAASIPSEGLRRAMEQWARKSESAAGINATLARFQTEEKIPVSANELDADRFLLNCSNGLLNLRGTAELLPHDRTKLITKLCHVAYSPTAEAPRFIRFLERIMGANFDAEPNERTARLVGFLQRAFGLALTGDVSEKAVFCFYGPGGDNGKTTLLELFRFILEEYSGLLNIDTLLVKPGGESNSSQEDLAALRGARFITTSEPDQGQRLRVGKFKFISAGDSRIKCRKLYESSIEFDATHKLFLELNERPTAQASDQALWNRIRCVPFLVSIPEAEKDLGLRAKLHQEAEGVLAWAVRGCLAWQQEGLGTPAEVGAENAAWRSASDPLKEFLEDCTECEPDAWITIGEMTGAYERWAAAAGEKYLLTRTKFADQLERRGILRERKYVDGTSGIRVWSGIRLKASWRPAL